MSTITIEQIAVTPYRDTDLFIAPQVVSAQPRSVNFVLGSVAVSLNGPIKVLEFPTSLVQFFLVLATPQNIAPFKHVSNPLIEDSLRPLLPFDHHLSKGRIDIDVLEFLFR